MEGDRHRYDPDQQHAHFESSERSSRPRHRYCDGHERSRICNHFLDGRSSHAIGVRHWNEGTNLLDTRTALERHFETRRYRCWPNTRERRSPGGFVQASTDHRGHEIYQSISRRIRSDFVSLFFRRRRHFLRSFARKFVRHRVSSYLHILLPLKSQHLVKNTRERRAKERTARC